jgi:hypothetical protein
MSTSILKTHYQQSATILTPGQIKEIRHLKNKVPVYMIVKEYHINKNRVHDIWNDCERSQQKGNHFFEELRKIQSISLVPPSENNSQDKENNHLISGSLRSTLTADPFHEMNAQEKQKKKKKPMKRTLQDQPKSIQSSDLSEISARGLYQNSTLDISHNIFASIEKDRIESEEAIRESEKLLGRNSPFNYIWTKNASQES